MVTKHFLWVVATACAIGFFACSYMFLPGGFSPDSDWQLAQALGQDRLSTWHPISMSLYWKMLITISGGKIAMLTFMRISAFWLAIFLLSRFVYIKTSSKKLALSPLLLGILPNILVVLHFNWKDSELAAYLLLGLGLILNAGLINIESKKRKRFSLNHALKFVMLATSLTFIAYAASVRSNGFIAAIPIMVLWFDQIVPPKLRDKLKLAYFGSVAIFTLLLSFGVNKILIAKYDPIQTSANVTMYALGIVNTIPIDEVKKIETDDNTKKLLIAYASGNCSRFNAGWNVTPWGEDCFIDGNWGDVFKGRYKTSDGLSRIWLNTIISNPVDFTSYMGVTFFNWLTSGAPMSSYTGEYDRSYPNSDDIKPRYIIGQRIFQIYNNNIGSKHLDMLYEKWVYLIASLAIITYTFKRKSLENRRIILSLSISSLLFLLSYTPSLLTSDYRYILWPVVSTTLAAILLVLPAILKKLNSYKY